MTLKHEDDTTGEQYEWNELNSDGHSDGLKQAGIIVGDGLYDDLEYHAEDADFEELRERLHEMVDDAVDSEIQAAELREELSPKSEDDQ